MENHSKVFFLNTPWNSIEKIAIASNFEEEKKNDQKKLNCIIITKRNGVGRGDNQNKTKNRSH